MINELGRHRRRPSSCMLLVVATLGMLAIASGPASAASPQISESWAFGVTATSARLKSEINPEGTKTSSRFEYITDLAFQSNLAKGIGGFAGATRTPLELVGAGTTFVAVSADLSLLSPATTYHYRVVATQGEEDTLGPAQFFRTLELPALGLNCPNEGLRTEVARSRLLDCRGYEMVSPVDKNGGGVGAPGALAAGGLLQAAAGGGMITYSSAASFGSGAGGSPPGSQYIASRGPDAWHTENITTPMLSGSYGVEPEGVPYQLFSGDLTRGLLLNGRNCRGEGGSCPVANPPLPGSGAPAGYQNYYLRSSTGGFTALLRSSDLALTPLGAARFRVHLAGASPDLGHVILSSCAALTVGAIEVPEGEGCDPGRPNLYEWSAAGLSLVNLLPGQLVGSPGASLAAQSAAISTDGSRVYWTDGNNLYLREGSSTFQVDAGVGGGGAFQTAANSGSPAFFTKAGHLYSYDAIAKSSTDLTPAGGVEGVLAASDDGTRVYYLTTVGLFLRSGATTTEVAADADAVNYPPTPGTARVSADGSRLAFVSSASLTGYDNLDGETGDPDSEVYLYTVGTGLNCVSCNPTNGRPVGPSTIPGAIANGAGPEATDSYKPRALVSGGRRLFFNSRDALVLRDNNNRSDVYEWEAQGVGSCDRSGGCLALLSSGQSEDGASFADASADGLDAYFLTGQSLIGADPGSVDLYDARVEGGYPVPPVSIPCEGDSCQILPPEPVDPALNTLVPGRGNPKVRYVKLRHRKARHHRRHARHHKGHRHRRGHP